MSRINTNISSIVAQNKLAKTNTDLATSLRRLSTGLRISRGADDPAGLIVSERLRSEINGIERAISNVERASSVIATTEAALEEVNTLLVSMKGLIIEAANTGGFSPEEVKANQLQIDSAIDTISRIANTTSFAGIQLLNGSLDYITSGVVTSAVNDVRIFGANFGTETTMPVSIEVLASAQHAQLYLSGVGASPTLASSVTIEVRGVKGVEVIQLTSGQTFASIAEAVNRTKDVTGISASIFNQSGLVFSSIEFGSDKFVSVQKLPGQSGGDSFVTLDELGGSEVLRDTGEDVLALINGSLAIGDGTTVGLRSSALQIEVNLTDTQATRTGSTNFSINGGGAVYQVGAHVNTAHQLGFGIQSVAASRLGNATTGFLSSVKTGGENAVISGKTREAADIIDAAIEQVSTLRGRLGAFEKNTLQSTLRSQQIALENLTASESKIRDTDFAKETANLTRAQILQSAGTSTLAIANSTAQSVLQLLQ